MTTELCPGLLRELLGEFLTRSNALLLAADPEGRVIWASPAWERAIGYSPAELANRRWIDFVHPADRDMTARAGADLFIGRELFVFNNRWVHRNGSTVHLQWTANASTEVTFAWAVEVTELVETRDLLANVLDASTEYAIVGMDTDRRIELWNEGARRMYGYEASEVVGRHRQDLVYTPADLAARLPDRIAESVLLEGKWEGEVARVRKDGNEFLARMTMTVRSDRDGNPTGFLTVTHDLTERERMERELRDQNVALERATKAKDRFLRTMSHELRTPMNAVLGFTGTLLMGLAGALTDEQRRQLEIVQSSGRHLLAIINDLLDLSRIESGRIEAELEPVVAQEVLTEVEDSLRSMAEAKGLELTMDVPPGEVRIVTDRRLVRQILTNLANNAIKFTDEGSVILGLRRDGDHGALFSVADTGPGIDPADLVRIFEAFERAGSARTRQFEGTGLGLYISRMLAELLGGRVTLESEPDVGTTFTLALPVN